ncbi:hypothetical protein MTYP_03213 [Methylophilaceae bacterium]|nr:hypothetical protein MTYP_03213 [Methylophilaceae bacterium]
MVRATGPAQTARSSLTEAPRHFRSSRNAAGLLPIMTSSSTVPGYEADIPRHDIKPATLALVLQGVAFAATFAAWLLLTHIFLLEPNFLALALFQGAIAMLLSGIFRMAVWWRFIQLIFPLAVFWTHGLSIPSWVYLSGFMLTVGLFWTTFRTQVPFYPSHEGVWRQVAQYLPRDRKIRMIDIGSGLGDLLLYLADRRPDSCFVGAEIAPLPWLVSRVHAYLRKSNARFYLRNYGKMDFAGFDVVFAYLSPAAMPAVWEKARREMLPGSILMSYEFEVAGNRPTAILQQEQGTPPIYVWHF